MGRIRFCSNYQIKWLVLGTILLTYNSHVNENTDKNLSFFFKKKLEYDI